MSGRIGTVFLPLLALGSAGFAGWHVYRANQPLPKAVPPIPPVTAPRSNTLAASGIVEPITEDVVVGTHVSGVVERVYVSAGERVAAGVPLFRIDTRQAYAELAVREAGLADAESQLRRLRSLPRPEELPASAARVSEAQAAVVAAEDAYRRTARLAEARTVPEAELISRRAELEQARQRLAGATADDALLKAGAWKEDIAVAESAVRRARAHVDQARTEIERLTVTSPIDGDVLKVDVRAGEQVGTEASQRLMVLGRVQPLCVRADFDESEIPRFDKTASARAHPRGDSGRSYRLRFVRVEPYVVPKQSLTGDNRERVDTRVLQVVYAVEDDSPSLFVGQQVDVFVDLHDRGEAGFLDDSPAAHRPGNAYRHRCGSAIGRPILQSWRACLRLDDPFGQASVGRPAYTSDTADEAAAIQLQCFGKLTPAERVQRACAMSKRNRLLAMEAIRRRHPGLATHDVQLAFIELAYGGEIAAQVRRWRQERTA